MVDVVSPDADHARGPSAAEGFPALSDADLVALVFRAGVRGRSSPAAAARLLARFGGLATLLGAPVTAIAAVPGVGPARAALFPAALELARRSLAGQLPARDCLASPAAVRDYLRLHLQHLGHEAFWAVFLDAQHRALAAEELFRGTLTQTSVYPREVVKRALAHNAAGVILAHNHPSGVPEPSFQDQVLTRSLAESLALVDVKVVDHFIVVAGGGLSFAERGLL